MPPGSSRISHFRVACLGGFAAALLGPAGILLPLLPLLAVINFVAVVVFHSALIPTALSLWRLWLLLAVMSIPGSLVVGGVLTGLLETERRHGASPRELREAGRFWGLVLGVIVWPLALVFTLPLLEAQWAPPTPGAAPLIESALIAGGTGAALGELVSRWLSRRPA